MKARKSSEKKVSKWDETTLLKIPIVGHWKGGGQEINWRERKKKRKREKEKERNPLEDNRSNFANLKSRVLWEGEE